MKLKSTLISLLAVGALGAAGFGLYQFGMKQGLDMHASTSMNANADNQPSMPASNSAAAASGTIGTSSSAVDPSNWGIPEGEEATRRHMDVGLKAGAVDPQTERKILYYHDPMVPGKKFEDPGKSPFMDMMLVPAYAGAAGADPSTVTISPRIQQNLGVRIGEVIEGPLGQDIVAVGSIAWNERDQALVQARAVGYVEKLYVRAVLDRVKKGQALFGLYVPDWVAVQEDYLSVRRMQGNGLAPLLDAARQRMRQAGMSEAQVVAVEKRGTVNPRTTLRAPISGALTELTAREGSTLIPGMTLARINGLSTVWAEAQVPESQAAQIKVGAAVMARSPALPGSEFEGRVQALLPEINVSTRTLKVRMSLRNPDAQLVPGMFVQMSLGTGEQKPVLLIPTEALIRTGQRVLVMTAEADGSFRPVEVITGTEVGAKTHVLRGLTRGEKVVLSGQFLIDSEASLKGIEARSATLPSYQTGARVEAVKGNILTLIHPEIPSLKWPAMTMDFKLAPEFEKSNKKVLRPGQDIEIEFRTPDGDIPEIVGIRLAGDKGRAQ